MKFMKREDFTKGQIYTHEQYMELSIMEMLGSKAEHTDRADPKVGAVLVDKNGAYFDKAHRGELRVGDHGEFTLLERKHHGEDLPGVDILRKHKSLTTKQYEDISGLKERQARNHLTALVDNGYAKKEGTNYIWIE